ncbi:MAG: hypothetical protein K0U66_07340 [Gammaproteobacteria bacterium]|nr:hypothetical protein [Gammaproteobacteria bacterium]
MRTLNLQTGCLWVTAVGLVILALVFGLGVLTLGVDGVSALMQTLSPWLLVWRLLVFVTLIGGWPLWVSQAAQRGWMTVDQMTELTGYRWLLAIWLLLLEGLLNQGLLIHFVDGLIGLL